MMPIVRWIALAVVAVGAGCISAAPPAPPVRWFDPLPARAAEAAARVPRCTVRVDTAPFLGREFVVRTGPREVALDGQHCWIAEPRQLVEVALADAMGGPADDRVLHVVVERFELDVQGPPRAHVRLSVDGGAGRRIVEGWADAADRSPEAFAAAMSEALGRAVAAVVGATAIR